ncbi:hypothetical protein C2W62_02970 [Candidatus Entotheonella serta]|nr:hypothetical protein C2W62_02970 [Candidatus Entotheonella serta]
MNFCDTITLNPTGSQVSQPARRDGKRYNTPTTITGGEAVVQALRDQGTEAIFGLPGIQIMSIYDALYEQSQIQLFTTRHEQTAAYMADGYHMPPRRPS